MLYYILYFLHYLFYLHNYARYNYFCVLVLPA